MCVAFLAICHCFIPPAAGKDFLTEMPQGTVGSQILQMNINICFEWPKCLLNKTFPNYYSVTIYCTLQNAN